MQAQTLTFIGLTRASLSVALALKDGLPDLVRVGHDPNDSDRANQAAEKEIFARAEHSLEKALSSADILILDLDPAATEKLFPLMAELVQPHAVITHLTPRAEAVQKLADKHLPEGFFVNAAPVQSVHTFGSATDDIFASADPNLFRDSLFCLMPSSKVDQAAVNTIRAIGQMLGSKPFFIDAAEYDVYTTATELLPQIAQLALFEALYSQPAWADIRRLAGDSFTQGTAEFADQGPAMASAIFSNKEASVHWINQMIKSLADVRGWIEKTDEKGVAQIISERSFNREEWLQKRKDNEWSEEQGGEVQVQNLREAFLGSLLGRMGRG